MKKIERNPFKEGFLYNVRSASYERLAEFGYDVELINDNARQFEWDKFIANKLSDKLVPPQGHIIPTVATLRNATLYRDGSALLPPKRGHHDQYILFDGGSYAPMTWINLHGDELLKRVHERRWQHKDRVTIPGRCLSTRTIYFTGVGHFVHEVLTRIYYENLGVIVRGRDKIIAPPYFQYPIHRFLFERIFDGYEIVHHPQEVALDVEELLISANLCTYNAINTNAIAELAARLREITVPYVIPEDYKVCISRRDGNNFAGRDFSNYGEFEDLLQDMGYKIALVSEMEPDEQFALFANTTDLIGIHGSGMINTMMMPPGGTHTEITGAPHIDFDTGKSDYRHLQGHNCMLRFATIIGHQVNAITSIRDQQNRPLIDLDLVKKNILDAVCIE